MRRWTLVVVGHGRWHYLDQTLRTVDLTRFDRHVMCLDGVDLAAAPNRVNYLLAEGWEIHSTGPNRCGLTANMGQAFAALSRADEWVAWLEEDFLIHDLPLDEMAGTLDAFPSVANMVLARQPVNPDELRAGTVLATIPNLTDHGTWQGHTSGFWLNPMVTHATLLRSLQPGVETSLTRQCRARHLTFGYWGAPNDPPRCTHIGITGGMGSPGWLP